MTRPQFVRADTIDLQAHETPSAQKHHRPTTDGSLAPHQAETLREVAAEAAEEYLRSPHLSWNANADDPQQHAHVFDSAAGGQHHGLTDNMPVGAQQDALAIAQNGGLSGHDADEADLDGDAEVDMEDDMDKISSSPSIEDGGSTLTLATLTFSKPGPLSQPATRHGPSASPDVCDTRSSSPYLASPDYMPLRREGREADGRVVEQSSSFPIRSRHHHLDGESEANGNTEDDASHEICSLPENTEYDRDGFWAGARDELLAQEDSNGECNWAIIPKVDSDDEAQNREDGDDLTVPYESDDEDDDGDFLGLSDTRFIDSGWGGECLQDTEDIDFDFVYALHTFVATVEGQANATKGDTMVLLDDSNSYWWLVRVVKDSSIGYLPAEHIETPTERLARLNKHRNIDLSMTMLTDQVDKARDPNPIRSAMKRRKTKTVQFAAPTYVDYSEAEYSTEEEDAEAEPFAPQQQQQGQQNQQSQHSVSDLEMEDETAKVEPLKPKSQQKQAKVDSKRQEARGDNASSSTNNKTVSRVVEEGSEPRTSSDGPKKTRDGTVRDSFFKDDTVETKKITLTPNLLRDDNGPRTSSESREMKQRPSLDKLEKDNVLGKDDKKKRKEKEKDKKPGGLRGFFSRKDKKSKGDEDDDSFGKRSMEVDAQEKDIEDDELRPSPEKGAPQRHPSKLQKQQPRSEPSPTRRSNSTRENGVDVKAFLSESRVNNVANVPPTSMRIVESSPKVYPEANSRDQPRDRDASPIKSPLSKASNAEAKPAATTAARSSMELDVSDSDEDATTEMAQQSRVREDAVLPQTRPRGDPPEAGPPASRSLQPAGSTSAVGTPHQQTTERLSESPVQVSPVNNNPPALMVDNSSQEEDRASPRSTPSPELIEHEDADTPDHKTLQTPSTTRSESWDDASLRAFFDSSSDIRDLLVVVYDKSNVDPVGSDHPVANSLFREQNAKLAEITTRLDDMLGDWLARKQRSRGAV
ncbi:uncharacterized protein B0T15DRAFT_496722 [Chaetomium strumarium]|uniref:SH3 domain-containing protein n=1 Tax=Chaetomium strumarium TaxID=1170767 RepID=A0AAJ0GLS6_9PEZI|nr:hypothetical protein B0T15DRAFT_496722 [Chaetomium strumarium]